MEESIGQSQLGGVRVLPNSILVHPVELLHQHLAVLLHLPHLILLFVLSRFQGAVLFIAHLLVLLNIPYEQHIRILVSVLCLDELQDIF